MEAWSIFSSWDPGTWGGWTLTFGHWTLHPGPCALSSRIRHWSLDLVSQNLIHFRPMLSILFPANPIFPVLPPIGQHPTVSCMQSSFVLDACSFANYAHCRPGSHLIP